jgi:CrcB protein
VQPIWANRRECEVGQRTVDTVVPAILSIDEETRVVADRHPGGQAKESVALEPEDQKATSPFARVRKRRLPSVRPTVLAVIFAGGVLGGLARYGITEAWSGSATAFPWSTLALNTIGAFALTLLVVLIGEVLVPRRMLRPLVGTGFLGAFTTFSSVMTTADRLLAHGEAPTAVLYLVGSVLCGAAAVGTGLLAARAVVAAQARTS